MGHIRHANSGKAVLCSIHDIAGVRTNNKKEKRGGRAFPLLGLLFARHLGNQAINLTLFKLRPVFFET